MPDPASACVACGAPTRLKYPPRGLVDGLPPDELRCTSDHLGEYDEIWGCPACGLAYQVFDRDPADLAGAYGDVVDPLYLAEEPRRREEFRELLGRVEALARGELPPAGGARANAPGRLLEAGSFAGLCLDEARARGWDAVGVEPSAWAGEHARRAYGADVVQGTLADAPWPAGSFDAVVMWDVLEHVPDPLDDLTRMRSFVRPGGVVAITTVNIAGHSARVLRARWPWLMRMHLWYFTPASLRLLFVRAGFDAVHVEGHPKRLSLGYVLQRAERFGGPPVRAARRVAERTGLGRRTLTIDAGDIVLAAGRAG